jgi:signal transduction histidine kinase|tara:strand:+ start:648 stop:2630 length:1983 start_codon:yes stop_codon:yes gene_type:complete
MTISSRLWVTLGITVLVLSCNIVLTSVLIDESNADLAQIVAIDKPLEQSVLQMGRTIRTSSEEIVRYVADQDEQHLINMLAARSEFESAADRYDQLDRSNGGQQNMAGVRLAYQDFTSLADEITSLTLRHYDTVSTGNEHTDDTDPLQEWLTRVTSAEIRVITSLDDLLHTLIDSSSSHVAGVGKTLSLYLTFATVMTIVMFLTISGAVYVVTISIDRGFSKLLRDTYRITRGESDQRIELDNKDEFGLLADAFNEMLGFRDHAQEEKNRIEPLLLHSQKMQAVGQLAGGVAHDFNNILTVIMGNVELIMDEVKQKLGRAKIMQMLQQVEGSANQAAMLTQQLLVFTRQEAVELAALDLNRTLSEVQKLLLRLIPESVVIEIKAEPDIPLIYADPGQITQVIVNLAVNASEAMPHGGALTIETANVVLSESHVKLHGDACEGQQVRLSVRDTGQGMNEEVQKHMFEPFYTTKPVGQGSGLGLATVYGIVVDKCSGHITIDSDEGQGCQFDVYFPAMAESAEHDSEAASLSTWISDDVTIMVCEDDRSVRELMDSILSMAGYTVIAAERASQALKLAAEHDSAIQLLITDVVMPEMNGKELADILTSLNPNLKTIFTSGYRSNVVGPGESIEFIEKPFTRDILVQRVKRVLNQERPKQLAG